MAIAPLYDLTPALGMLSGKWPADDTEGKQTQNRLMAEMLLGLQQSAADPYTGDDAERLAYAVVLQINFQMARGMEPMVTKSVSNTHPGNTTTYRDRIVSPDALAIVTQVTGRAIVGFEATGA